ncbi:hypothetical protein QJS10_CPB22g00786 [Acorus calamus]|uniref:Uncharacterized protein n=1 Tax=Acorus calamus TaxID=4465 RepID=A0AAV9C085_ACOCL|nr:hypothetical protein QJS10_CPB22g00786 [Acorus calamus]
MKRHSIGKGRSPSPPRGRVRRHPNSEDEEGRPQEVGVAAAATLLGWAEAKKYRVAEQRRNWAYYPQYRSTVHRIFETFATLELSKRHSDMLRRIPLWNLFKSFIDRPYDYSKTKKK